MCSENLMIQWLNCHFFTRFRDADFANKQFFNLWTNENLEESHRAITILLTHPDLSKSLVSLCTRIHYKIVSTAEFQKPRHVDPVSSSLSPVGWANSIRPFSTRSPMLSRNLIRKAGGMHQLVKLRYLVPFPPPVFPLGASQSLVSYDIILPHGI